MSVMSDGIGSLAKLKALDVRNNRLASLPGSFLYIDIISVILMINSLFFSVFVLATLYLLTSLRRIYASNNELRSVYSQTFK